MSEAEINLQLNTNREKHICVERLCTWFLQQVKADMLRWFIESVFPFTVIDVTKIGYMHIFFLYDYDFYCTTLPGKNNSHEPVYFSFNVQFDVSGLHLAALQFDYSLCKVSSGHNFLCQCLN